MRCSRASSRTGAPAPTPATRPITLAPRPPRRVMNGRLRPLKRALTGVVLSLKPGSQRAVRLAVVICAGAEATLLVCVASVSTSRTLCGPSASAAVSNDSLPVAVVRHGTQPARVNAFVADDRGVGDLAVAEARAGRAGHRPAGLPERAMRVRVFDQRPVEVVVERDRAVERVARQSRARRDAVDDPHRLERGEGARGRPGRQRAARARAGQRRLRGVDRGQAVCRSRLPRRPAAVVDGVRAVGPGGRAREHGQEQPQPRDARPCGHPTGNRSSGRIAVAHLHVLEAEAALDAQVAARDVVVVRR